MIFAILVAFSRIYVDVHYPLNILIGSTIGVMIRLIMLNIYRKDFKLKNDYLNKIINKFKDMFLCTNNPKGEIKRTIVLLMPIEIITTTMIIKMIKLMMRIIILIMMLKAIVIIMDKLSIRRLILYILKLNILLSLQTLINENLEHYSILRNFYNLLVTYLFLWRGRVKLKLKII